MRPAMQLANSPGMRSEEHTSELQSLRHLVWRLLLEKKMELLERHSFGKTHGVNGGSVGAVVRMEEVHHEDETHGQKGFISMYFFFKINGPPREHPFSPPRAPPH